jgi:uncharacterized membrane protein YqjE
LDRPPGESGPLGSARALGASLLALLGTRVELAAIELKEETERRKRLAVLALVAALFLGAGLLLLAFLLVVLFWDTHRLAAIAGVTLLYSAIGAWALLRFRAILRDSPPPFSATLDEFKRDLDMVRGNDA